MFELPVREIMQRNVLLSLPAETTVSEAAKRMLSQNVGAVLIVDRKHLIGIFTERDAVFRVIAQGLDTRTTPLAAVMTAPPVTLGPEKSYGHALVLMQEHRFRHVPIVENGNAIGIVTARDALDPELEEYVSEQRQREFLRR